MISQQTIQQILSRIDIIEIVGGFVKLKKRGANYLGLCPFHNEKTPSFTVSPTKEIYKCFGCGRSGNTISFLMEHEKYSYVEALRWLAAKYNVQVEETEVSPEVKQLQQVADSLYIINNFAQKYFTGILFNHDEGISTGLSYLKERGYREDIIQKFQLGYCLAERDAFVRTALTSQYSLDSLIKSGLVVLRDETPVDNYRGRIIFPVHNHTGKIIGFGARILAKNDKAPKYINTPENELYVKSKLLYGTWFARQAIDRQDECLLVEGYTDVISLHQAGIENVVASGGTSLTIDQLRLIKKYTNNLTIIYDGDEAGVKAALRGLDMALEESLNVKLVLIPGSEDPDSYVNKVGATKFKEFVQQEKKDFVLFQLEVLLREAGNDSAKKAIVVNHVAETIAKVNKAEDFTRQQDYIRQSAQLLRIDENGLNTLVNKYIREKYGKLERTVQEKVEHEPTPPPEEDTLELLQKDELQERGLVRCLLEFGLKTWDGNKTVADYLLEEFVGQGLIDDVHLLLIMERYKQWYEAGREPVVKTFLYDEDQQLSSYVVRLMEFPYELSPNWKEHFEGKIFTRDELYIEEVTSTVNYLKLRKVKRMIEENQIDLERAPTADEQMMLLKTHRHLKELETELVKQTGTVIVK
ncbi:MAG TPA: DNA primase [Flavitalea sp.]|nr:DNA primase [Flavitalea sp.]